MAVALPFTTSAELVGHWNFDQGKGDVAHDSSGNANHGRARSARWEAGEFGCALYLTGKAGSSVVVPDTESLRLGRSDFTIECWVRPDVLTTRIMGKSAYPDRSWWCLDMYGGRVQMEMTDDSRNGGTTSADGFIRLAGWAHLAIVVDRQNRNVGYYLNGRLDSKERLPASFTGSLDAQGADLVIGSSNEGSWYRGHVDEVRIFRRTLTDEEIKMSYEQQKDRRPAAEAKSNRDGAAMLYIPPGEFVMGTSVADAEALAGSIGAHETFFKHETPQRKVQLKGFLIDKYPVTNAQYKKFIDETLYGAPSGWVGRNFSEGTADHPVANVNWQAANTYARWAGKRLPTAQEWEKAARGTDGRVYPWGNEWDAEATRRDDLEHAQTRALATPVGCFPKGTSPYGVMDLCGNVAEWTGTASDPNLWGGCYTVKGAGAAHGLETSFRCAHVNFSAHTSRFHPWLGFRCAMDCDGPPKDLPEGQTPVREPPPVTPCTSPIAEKYGKESIAVVPSGGSRVRFEVPYLPEANFSLFVPEASGAKGVPLAWKGGRPSFKWQVNDDRTAASYECTFEGKAVQKVMVQSGLDYVDFTIALKNLTSAIFTGVHTNTCFNSHHAPYFFDIERARTMVWDNTGPVSLMTRGVSGPGEPLHGGVGVAAPGQQATASSRLARHPFIFIVSRDREYVIAQAYGDGRSVGTNAHYSCLHVSPVWPDIPPGQERSVTGKLYFLKGQPQDLLERWKRDFGK